MSRKRTTPVADLFLFTLTVLALGMLVGLLCHYADYGWNPGSPTWAKVLTFVCSGSLLVGLVLQFISLAIKLTAEEH